MWFSFVLILSISTYANASQKLTSYFTPEMMTACSVCLSSKRFASTDLSGKRAIVTGASSGLGYQFADTLSGNNVRVLMVSSNRDKLHKAAESLAQRGRQVTPFVVDVSQATSLKNLSEMLNNENLPVDILVNNAGTSAQTPIFQDTPIDTEQEFLLYRRITDTNLFGTWCMTRLVAQHMKKLGTPGSIINIGSVAGLNSPRRNLALYGASKAGVIHLTKSLVGELSPHGIRINCIVPGLTATPLTQRKIDSDEKGWKERIPLETIGRTTDFQEALLFLASNSSSRYVTGSSIVIDGGISWGGL